MADTPIFEIKPILGEEINKDQFLQAISGALYEEAKKVLAEFDKGTETWTHKPKWNVVLRKRYNDWVLRISTGSKPFLYVEAGTKVRKRRMSKDFQRKTEPRVLKSEPGAGHAGSFMKPPYAKGITARDFRVVIEREYQDNYSRNMGAAVSRASKNFFSGTPIAVGGAMIE